MSKDPLDKLSFRKIIKQFDYMGSFITFRINGESDYKSILGGVTSILYFSFCIYYIIYSAIPFFGKKNLNFIYANQIVESNPIVDFTGKQMMFAFGYGFVDQGLDEAFLGIPFMPMTASDLILDTIGFDISLKITNGNHIESIPINKAKCRIEQFPKEAHEFFTTRKIEKYFCPDFSSLPPNVKLQLAGLPTDSYQSSIEIRARFVETPMALFLLEDQRSRGVNVTWYEFLRDTMEFPLEVRM